MAYAAPVPSSPPVASANYANSAGSANTANYANTAGYANSSGLPAYSQWENAINARTGYIYVYMFEHDTSRGDSSYSLVYLNNYIGPYYGGFPNYYTFISVLADN